MARFSEWYLNWVTRIIIISGLKEAGLLMLNSLHKTKHMQKWMAAICAFLSGKHNTHPPLHRKLCMLTQQSWHVLENSEQLGGDGWAVL